MKRNRKPQKSKPKKPVSKTKIQESVKETVPSSMLLENFPSGVSNWYPGIEQACNHWREAPMLQQVFEAFRQSFDKDNDAVIGAARSLVEVVCQIIIDEYHTEATPFKPNNDKPGIKEWLGCAVKALKLGTEREKRFQDLIRAHNKLAEALSLLRDKDCPVSHGREGYLDRLTAHHRRTIALTADAIVSYLFEAFMESHINLELTREPYERFLNWNTLIDQTIITRASVNEEDGMVNLDFVLPDPDSSIPLDKREQIALKAEPSRLLYQLDRPAYILARNASLNVTVEDELVFEDSVQDEVVPAL